MSYIIKKSSRPLIPGADASHPQWENAVTLKLSEVINADSGHIPETEVKMLYDDNGIAGVFSVKDRYVIGKATGDQQPVCRDSCVEFFVHPAGDKRYFNLEMSCTGNILLYHVENCRAEIFDVLPQEDLDTIVRKSSLPSQVVPEITDSVNWTMSFYIPVELFVKHSGIDPVLCGQKWTANFTKCADDCSHPHWLSWQQLSKLDFHLPAEFGEIIFE